MPPVFDPARFNFDSQSIDIDGISTSGGTALSGITDYNQSDGGGFWRAEFSDGEIGGTSNADREDVLAWRSIVAQMKRGTRVVDVLFNDRWHQPVLGIQAYTNPAPDLISSSLFRSGGAVGTVTSVVNGQSGGLRATIITADIRSERQLKGGERFTLLHSTWGPRAYQIATIEDGELISFIPPIRGGVAVGDSIDFDTIACRMQLVSATDSLSLGLYADPAASFVEYMRSPDE